MHHLKKPSGRKAHFECLENRTLLAGNVSALVDSGGDLVITGDAASNSIQVTQISANTWKVTGIGTTVNGSHSFIAPGVTRSMGINMQQGNNTVQVLNGSVPGAFDFSSLNGNDVLTLSKLTIGSSIDIEAANGNNVISLSSVTAASTIAISGGVNTDSITLSNVHGSGLNIQASNGTNTIAMNHVTTPGGISIDGGLNQDVFALANISANDGIGIGLSNGTNIVTLTNITALTGGLGMDSGDGSNTVVLTNINLASDFSYDAGQGRDVISLNNFSADDIGIGTGTSNDVISLTHVTTPNGLSLGTGSGTDVVSLNSVDAGASDIDVDVGPGNYDRLAIANCTAGTEELSDTGGTNGTIVGAANHFATAPTVDGFRWRYGI